MNYNPHKHRVNHIKGLFLLIGLGIVLIYLYGCRTPRGNHCPGTRGMSGYGWLKSKKTNEVFVLNPAGKTVCTYYEPIQIGVGNN